MEAAGKSTSVKCLLFHIVPWFGRGGVEIAAAAGAKEGGGLIHTHFLTSRHNAVPKTTENVTHGPAGAIGPAAILSVIGEVRRRDPQVLVFSLWRSVGAFLALRLLYPRKKFVLFLHVTRRLHSLDAIATRIMMAACDEVWGDSIATIKSQCRPDKPSKVISMLVYKAARTPKRPSPAPTFVSWCRLNKQKRVDRALDLVARLKERYSDVTYTVIGPDDGCLKSLEAHCRKLGLGSEVRFVGGQGREFIQRAAERSTFYIQLSDYEGQAMAVVEASQFGLIPVVTPVGGLTGYCRDGVNCILVKDSESAAKRISALLHDQPALCAMAEAARATFDGAPTYTESVIASAQALSGQRAQ